MLISSSDLLAWLFADAPRSLARRRVRAIAIADGGRPRSLRLGV